MNFRVLCELLLDMLFLNNLQKYLHIKSDTDSDSNWLLDSES